MRGVGGDLSVLIRDISDAASIGIVLVSRLGGVDIPKVIERSKDLVRLGPEELRTYMVGTVRSVITGSKTPVPDRLLPVSSDL